MLDEKARVSRRHENLVPGLCNSRANQGDRRQRKHRLESEEMLCSIWALLNFRSLEGT